MSDQNTADNWRLDDTGKTDKQWKLQETEQNRIAQWELQDESYEDANWQPVLYEREPRQQGGGWVLPSLVGLALVAVVAYGAWIGLTQFTPGAFNLGNLISAATFTPAPANTSNDPSAVAGAVTEVATETPTEAPATQTPEPIATLPVAPTAATPAMVELTYARITNQYGVNARSGPSTDAELIELLDQGETYLLQQSQDGWLQIALTDGRLAWISADFAEQLTQQKPLAEANAELAAAGLPPLAAPEGPTSSAPVSTTTPLTSPVVTTPGTTPGTTPETTPITPTTPLVATTITGTVNITAGLNARSAPSADAALVTLLPGNTVLTLTGRTADNTWLSTTVSDSVAAWVFAEYITVNGAIGSLPAEGTTTPITGTLLTTTTPPVATTPTVTTTTAPTDTASAAPTGATATVNTILGAGVRQGPNRDADAIGTLPFDRVYSVLARSADDQWVQIALEANQQGWVLVSSVTLNVELATLPVVVP